MVGERSFCRLTVLAPRRRVDVALPADVPVAELVPMVLELVGEPGGQPWHPRPWRLAGIAGGPLPGAATLAQLGVLDGELLRIGPEAVPPPAPVFDDPIDALAATAGTSGPAGRRFGAAVAVAVACAAAGLLATAPGSLLGAALAALGSLAALVHTARTVQVAAGLGFPAQARLAAHTSALVAVVLAGAAGWTAVPGGSGLLLAVGAAGTVAAIGQVLLRVVAPVLVAAVVAAGLAAVAVGGVRFGVAPVVAAAAVTGIGVVLGPVLPRAAIRLAGLPRPVVPADAADLADADSAADLLPPGELAERADLARGYLAGLSGGCAVVAVTGALMVARGGTGWPALAFAGVVVAALGLGSRGYADPAPARTSAAAAVAGGVGLAALAGTTAGGFGVPVAAAGLLVAVAVGVAALGRTGATGSPVVRRAVDIVEGVLVAATVPLALSAMDLFRVLRGL